MKIERLKIGSSKPEEQLEFYRDVLGLEVLQQKADSFKVRAGYSLLEFHLQENATPYHIAFHIPAYREEQALQWLKTRTAIITDGEQELVDFPHWNARSVYFYDADHNILEFISRRHCFPSESEGFSSQDILGISEIGLATSNVKETFDFLHNNFHLNKFTGDTEVFCATGDDQGLFIVVNKEKKSWFPSNDPALAADFEIKFTTEGGPSEIAYKNQRLELL